MTPCVVATIPVLVGVALAFAGPRIKARYDRKAAAKADAERRAVIRDTFKGHQSWSPAEPLAMAAKLRIGSP